MTTPKAPPLTLYLREFPYLLPVWANVFRRVKPSELPPAPTKGQPVLVMPGILSGDRATSLLRRSLDAAGYNAHGSKFRFVTGITPARLAHAEQRLAEIYERTGQKVVLLGWSLGGIYTRVLAQRHPEKVAMVVTLGSPFSGDRHANRAWRVYEALNDHTVDAPSLPDDPSQKPPVRTVAVWSPIDGVIAPECARGQDGECDCAIEVPTRHFAYGSSRKSINEIVRIIGEELPKAVSD